MSADHSATHRWSGAGYVCIECGAIKNTPQGDRRCQATCEHDFTETCAPACKCEYCWITYAEFKAMKPKEATPIMPPPEELSVSMLLNKFRALTAKVAAYDRERPILIAAVKAGLASTRDALILAIQFNLRATERAMRKSVDELEKLLEEVSKP